MCGCVCSVLDRASLYDTKPGFLSPKIQCRLPLQRPGLFLPSHLDQHRGSSVAPKRTILPFLSATYIPPPPIFPEQRHTFIPKGAFDFIQFVVFFRCVAFKARFQLDQSAKLASNVASNQHLKIFTTARRRREGTRHTSALHRQLHT